MRIERKNHFFGHIASPQRQETRRQRCMAGSVNFQFACGIRYGACIHVGTSYLGKLVRYRAATAQVGTRYFIYGTS